MRRQMPPTRKVSDDSIAARRNCLSRNLNDNRQQRPQYGNLTRTYPPRDDSEGSSLVISSTAARRWQIAHTRPMGCGTLIPTDLEVAAGERCLFLRFSCSCALRTGSARRRRMFSRLFFRRRARSESEFSHPQFPWFVVSSVRSSITVASPASRVCHPVFAHRCSNACVQRRTFNALPHAARFGHGSLRFSSSTETSVL